MSERKPVVWLTYRGDQTGITEAINNPVPAFMADLGPLGVARMPMDTRRGPDTMGSTLWPVVAEYDSATDRTRVGFTYLPPEALTRVVQE